MTTGDEEAVRRLVLAERAAKDLARWDEMGASFEAGSTVRVSWFQGSGPEFVAAARRRHEAGGATSFHEIGAVDVVVRGDRALAEASCTVHVRGALASPDGPVEVDVASRGRVHWRAQRRDRWLIAGLDMIYLRDTVAPVDPDRRIPPAAAAGAGQHRSSYRWIALLLAGKGHRIDPDLPGVDRPDLVDAFLAEQRAWLSGGG